MARTASILRAARVLVVNAVRLQDDAVVDRPGGGVLEADGLRRFREDSDTAAEYEREHLQVNLVDEAGGEESMHDRAAAGNEDRAAVLLLECTHCGFEVGLDYGRVLPRGGPERGRGDYLAHRVDLVCHRAVAVGPRTVEAVVRLAAEQKDVRGQLLLSLVGAEGVAEERADPAGVGIAGLTAGGLHDAVEGDELGDDQCAHRASFPGVVAFVMLDGGRLTKSSAGGAPGAHVVGPR